MKVVDYGNSPKFTLCLRAEDDSDLIVLGRIRAHVTGEREDAEVDTCLLQIGRAIPKSAKGTE